MTNIRFKFKKLTRKVNISMLGRYTLQVNYNLAFSRLRGSLVRENTKTKREKTGVGFFPATAPFFKITRSHFRVPFTYASSLLSKSLEQAELARK